MSRNIRKKQPTTPVKASKNRRRRVSDTSTSSGSLDLSDEGGYSAVEDISDSSDDDEEDVVAAEEESILKEAHIQSPAPRPFTHISDEEEEDEADDEKDDEDDDDDEPIDDDEDNGSWAGIMSDVEDHNDHLFREGSAMDSDVVKHVHFVDSGTDSSSTETDVEPHDDMFPDIFISQTALDPSFRREIENDHEGDSDASGTFWDFHDQHGDSADSDAEEIIRQLVEDETPFATPMASQAPTAASSPVLTFEVADELDAFDDCKSCLLRDMFLTNTPQPKVIPPKRKMNPSLS